MSMTKDLRIDKQAKLDIASTPVVMCPTLQH